MYSIYIYLQQLSRVAVGRSRYVCWCCHHNRCQPDYHNRYRQCNMLEPRAKQWINRNRYLHAGELVHTGINFGYPKTNDVPG